MSKLIPVIYRNMKYPLHINAKIHEVSGNFYKEKLIVKTPYSLHTEPSAVPKTFCSKIIKDLKHLKQAQKNNIPQLWYSEEWAKDFFKFVDWLIGSNKPPEVLEIHPPFNDYCTSFEQFLKIFKVFHEQFIKKYPATKVFIENRLGTRYKDGKFLLSKCSDILEFCDILSNSNIGLKIVIDYSQLFSAEVISSKGKKEENWMGKNPSELLEKIISFNQSLKQYKELVSGLHMWGKLNKYNRWIPHAGNLDTFFSSDIELKQRFLKSVFSAFDDGITRYFVPEVHSGTSDLHAIVKDMEEAGFVFT